jgi:hypothetical protein
MPLSPFWAMEIRPIQNCDYTAVSFFGNENKTHTNLRSCPCLFFEKLRLLLLVFFGSPTSGADERCEGGVGVHH